MPYGDGPKSGWTRRVAVGFDAVRPLMKSMYEAEAGSAGARLMSRFHQLLRGNTCRPPSEPPGTGAIAPRTSTPVAMNSASASDAVRTYTRPFLQLPCRP